MAANTIRLGGVPEHFNYPWHLYADALANQKSDFLIHWKDFPGGSGAMIGALEVGELDAALVLTESVVHALNRNAAIVPLSLYVESPLVWGIFSGAQSAVNQVDIAAQPRYAISRFGSGSHLMAVVDAHMRGGTIAEHQWVVVQSLARAKEVLRQNEADLFFWEKWMTKPLVDQGILKMVDERPTPWSCFTLVCTTAFSEDPASMAMLRKAMLQTLGLAREFREQADAADLLAAAYHLQPDDAASWLQQVRWAPTWTNPEPALEIARNWLKEIEINKL